MMYRSRRADKKYLLGWLKVACICAAILIFVGVAILAFLWGVEESEAIPVLAELYDTYSWSATENVLVLAAQEIKTSAQIPYEDCEIIEDEFVIPVYQIPTRTPGVYRTKIISLTFDDGPAWPTEYLLDILDAHEVRVTFCVIGNLVEDGAETVKRAFEAGHEIVGHSWDHRIFARLSVQAITEQITRTSEIIEYVTGEPPPPIFRVPFGQFNTRIRTASHELGYGILNWSIDPEDWRERCEEHIYEFIMEHARDGAIILLHDIHPTTIYAMEKVVPALLRRGFQLVTATELIYYIYGELEPGFEFTGTRR